MKEIKDLTNSGLAQFDNTQSTLRLKRIGSNDFFSQKTTNKISVYLFPTNILQNFKKFFRAGPEL